MTLPRGCDDIVTLALRFVSVALEPALLFAVFLQLVAKLGMSDLDERLGALAYGAPMQIGHTVFRDNVMHIPASGQHAGAMSQAGHDSRDGFALGGRRQCDDRLAVLGARRAADEVQLSAESAVETWPNGLGANLARSGRSR